ncbi:MAG TPA: phosphoglycerate dehydrogenase [Vicinamibacteria bacterium]|nr:phosphoglycerate dehydrogenase [Vicinamibacteria bacterium]
MSYKILVLEGITERGLQLLKAEGWQVDEQKAMPPLELAAIVAPYHAMTIRSGSQITAEVLEAASSLKVVGRPGVGVDNVDLEAATRLGIMVMNSPTGNLVSTAELTLALLFAVARNVAQADAAMKAGRWERKALPGVELSGKRLGVVGFGRIGREVAARCRALGMEIAAFDPFVAPAVAEGQGVPMLPLDELLATSDFLTLHTTLTRDSRHLVGRHALAKVKRGVRIVNAARGELIDEEALLDALEDGRVAAAGLDVHAQEPPTDWRLVRHPRVVATPHVGAQTLEAQERVGTDIAVQVRDFLKGGIIQHAVNFFSLSGDVYDQVKPAMDLAQRLGTFLAQACPGRPERIEVGLYGDLREIDANPILAAAVCGVLRCALPDNVTLVNARSLAEERGIDVLESTSSAKLAFSNLMAIRLKTSDRDYSVAGTLFGRNHLRLVDVDGVEMDAIPQGHLLLVKNDDTPGVVGHLGGVLGQRNINIARMTVGRKPGSGRAVMLIEVDNEVAPDALAEVARVPGVREARALRLG